MQVPPWSLLIWTRFLKITSTKQKKEHFKKCRPQLGERSIVFESAYVQQAVRILLFKSRQADIGPISFDQCGVDLLEISEFIFSEAFINYQVCSPSRSSMLTSRRPDTTRVQDLYAWWMASNFKTIPESKGFER